MTSSLTQSERPIERARRAMRIASSAVRQPAVFGRMRYRFQSITSRIVFLLGSSRSRRRSATVMSSLPDASRAASIDSSVGYLPVPKKRRDRSVVPATTSGSACVNVCTPKAYRGLSSPFMGRCRRSRRRGLVQVVLSQQGLVASVAETLDGLIHGQPEQLVDLDAGPEAAALDLHDPVAHDLVAASAIDVRGTSDRPAQLTAQASLPP